MSEELPDNISWTSLLEEYFASTAEKCNCFSWLHSKAESKYNYLRTFIDLPVIIGSGAIAFLNAGSQSLFADDVKMSSVALGVGSLVVSILNTVGSYFSWSKRAENHRLSSIAYAKLHRFILVEMNLPRKERIRPTDLLKMVKDRYDQLAETSPAIPDGVISTFKSRFSDKKYDEISKPEITNGLEKVRVFVDIPSNSAFELNTPPTTPKPDKEGKL